MNTPWREACCGEAQMPKHTTSASGSGARGASEVRQTSPLATSVRSLSGARSITSVSSGICMPSRLRSRLWPVAQRSTGIGASDLPTAE